MKFADAGKARNGEEGETISLRRKAEDALRKTILTGRYAPGDRLKERELMELLNVSRTLAREALRQVEAEGLIEIVPNRGPVVAVLSYEEAEEIYEVRGVLEAQSCSGFALRANSEQMRMLDSTFAELVEAGQKGDVPKAVSLSDVFYDVVAAGCGNQLLATMLRQLHNRIVLLRRTSLSVPNRLPETMYELTQIYDALKARDEVAAGKAALHHVRQASRIALKVLRDRQANS
ncbi:GntR family transcriptional regulator [Bordetella sp. 15P40C-2]|uniref:GntR family transcriptional regulator n=1 Tax=Bordetella sp. 15P40C-2 TaxID=2572246 RepID=UPI001326AD3B|nr:GntR family transcriptional regulator [Bordetella sp. 15P40C-2]MVW71516.1 FCD domain-containing protein [Bordetella sp. 15P40C-2]